MKNFAMNASGYFFDITFPHVAIEGVEYFDDRHEMYKRAAEVTGQDVDELEYMELIVRKGDTEEEIVIVDDRGCKEYFADDELADVIRDYVI